MVNAKWTKGSLGMVRAILVLAALLCFGAIARAQQFITPAEERYSPYYANLPACDNTWVTGRINDRFQQKESSYWNSTLTIEGYDRFKEIGFRANGVSYIPRRYCIARVTMSDQKQRTIIYAHPGRHRHHRLGLGRRMVRRRARPQFRLFAGLQRAASVRRAISRRRQGVQFGL